MKKKLTFLTVFVLVLLSFSLTASAEQFDGFSIDFPSDFTGAYTSVDTDMESDFFTQSLLYETESEYEKMQVMIGKSNNLDRLFESNFGFANRQDLDLSLLTEQQLANEADELTAYIDKSFPLYMTYVTPKSMVVDNRLCLMVTGYYTDYQGGLTGEFRAYEFYYMGDVVIIYYDTQIDDIYFVESVFELPDSIVASIDFDLNPAVQPTNAALYKEIVTAAAPVGGFLLLAVVLGILFGMIFKKSPKSERDLAMLLSPDEPKKDKKDAAAQEPIVNTVEKKEPAQEPPTPTQPVPEPSKVSISETEIEEAVDWNSMLSALKKENGQEKPKDESVVNAAQKNIDADLLTGKASETKEATAPVAKTEETTVSPEPQTEKINAEMTPETADEEADPLLAQLKAMDDMSAEISATLGSLEKLSTPAAAAEDPASDQKKTEPPKKEAITFISPTVELDIPKSKNAETVSENYQSYMNSLLPTRKKPKAADVDEPLAKKAEEKMGSEPKSARTEKNKTLMRQKLQKQARRTT